MSASDLFGVMALCLVVMACLLLCVKYRDIALVIFVALFLRLLAALTHYYVMPLPDGHADALAFEGLAWEWGQDGLLVWLQNFPGVNSYTYSWFSAFLYVIFDRSPLMIQATSIFAGVLSVIYSWKLSMLIWGSSSAKKVAWVSALFPMLIQYSALTMREAWITLFLLIALFNIAKWVASNSIYNLFKVVLALVGATIMHGGMFVALLAFMTLVLCRSLKALLVRIPKHKIQPKGLFFIILIFGLGGGVVVFSPSIPKFGNIFNVFSFEIWDYYFSSRVRDSAAYPSWTQPSSSVDLIWAVPLRAFYLLFSPFPWDIRSPGHLIGMLDAFFYMIIFFFFLKNFKAVRDNPMAMAVFYILLALIFSFGVGTGNFGTAIRHRAKFVIALLVLASPKLKKFSCRRLS